MSKYCFNIFSFSFHLPFCKNIVSLPKNFFAMKNKLPSMNILLNGSKTVNGRYGYGYGY